MISVRYQWMFWPYIVCVFARIAFHRSGGALLFWVGCRLRRHLDPEFSHRAFLKVLRFRLWVPAWMEAGNGT